MLKRLIAINHKPVVGINHRWIGRMAHDAVINIPSFSRVLIGGFGNRLVPEALINVLASESKSHHLTLLTNVKITNPSLKSLIDSGRVARLVTMSNNSISNDMAPGTISSGLPIELVDTIKFTQLCRSSGSEYALIRSSFMDDKGCHYWMGPSSGNFLMGKWARRLTIGQFDRYAEIGPNNVTKDMVKLERMFVPVVSQADAVSMDDERADLGEIDSIVKRALLELVNNDVVFFSTRAEMLTRIFHAPNHINIRVVNKEISQKWLVDLDWLAWVSKLTVCIVEAHDLTENGQIRISDDRDEDTQRLSDVLANLRPHTKLIALLVNPETAKKCNNTDNVLNLKTIDRRPDMVVSQNAVFKWDKSSEMFCLVEAGRDFDAADFEGLDFRFLTSSSIASMKS